MYVVLRRYKLLCGLILHLPVLVRGELRMRCFGVAVLQQNFFNVPLHG